MPSYNIHTNGSVYHLSPHIVNSIIKNYNPNKPYTNKAISGTLGLEKVLNTISEINTLPIRSHILIGPVTSLFYRISEILIDSDNNDVRELKYMLEEILYPIREHIFLYEVHRPIYEKIRRYIEKYDKYGGKWKKIYGFLADLAYSLMGLHIISHYSRFNFLDERKAKYIIGRFKEDLVRYVSYLIYGENYLYHLDRVSKDLSGILSKVKLKTLAKDGKNYDVTNHPVNRLITSVLDSIERYIINSINKA